MFDQNPDIEAIVEQAVVIAIKYKHSFVTVEHLLLALLRTENFRTMVLEFGANWEEIHSELQMIIEIRFQDIIDEEVKQPKKTHALERVFSRAFTQVLFSGRPKFQTMDLYISIANEPNSYAAWIMRKYGVDTQKLIDFYNFQYTGENELKGVTNKAIRILEEFCTNLNTMVDEGKIDPVIGRIEEINDISETLARKIKNNVIMVGDPGVGKTAVVEGLAHRIYHKNVPTNLLELRCQHIDEKKSEKWGSTTMCNKLLSKIVPGTNIEVKCPRCKNMTISLEQFPALLPETTDE